MAKDKIETVIDFKNIKNSEELETILDSIYKQGFGYLNSSKAHQDKIKKIIEAENKFNVDDKKFSSDITDFHKMSDYSIIKRKAEEIFSKFGADDKINEYLNKFDIVSSLSAQVPSSGPYDDVLINWYKFKTKFNLKDIDVKKWDHYYYYDLDKPKLKVRFGNNKYEFVRFYKLLFGETCPDFSTSTSGWIDLVKIKIKIYSNGNCDISGDISKLKEYYYNYLKKQTFASNIIKYNKKLDYFLRKKGND